MDAESAMQVRGSRPVCAVVVALLVSLAGGCGGQMGSPDPPATPLDGVYEIRGVVVAVDTGRSILEINHEAIPGVMPAMTMPYEVAEPRLLQGLAAGDRVRGTLRVDNRGQIITSLEKV
jgi:Cu/Ag efflux protein CusF